MANVYFASTELKKMIMLFLSEKGGGMLFEARKGDLIHEGQLFYKKDELSFDFLPTQAMDCTVLIADLNLDFDLNHRDATQVWGYHQCSIWKICKLATPEAFSGELILLDETFQARDIGRLPGTFEWETYYDAETGWICIGETYKEEDAKAVQFATGCVAVVHDKRLIALWLRPIIIDA